MAISLKNELSASENPVPMLPDASPVKLGEPGVKSPVKVLIVKLLLAADESIKSNTHVPDCPDNPAVLIDTFIGVANVSWQENTRKAKNP